MKTLSSEGTQVTLSHAKSLIAQQSLRIEQLQQENAALRNEVEKLKAGNFWWQNGNLHQATFGQWKACTDIPNKIATLADYVADIGRDTQYHAPGVIFHWKDPNDLLLNWVNPLHVEMEMFATTQGNDDTPIVIVIWIMAKLLGWLKSHPFAAEPELDQEKIAALQEVISQDDPA